MQFFIEFYFLKNKYLTVNKKTQKLKGGKLANGEMMTSRTMQATYAW